MELRGGGKVQGPLDGDGIDVRIYAGAGNQQGRFYLHIVPGMEKIPDPPVETVS
jgi:hypothetical protein